MTHTHTQQDSDQLASHEYLTNNKDYWEKGYEAPNVDHQMFRFFGRILKPQFKLPSNNEKLLDFGCGQGAAVNYFHLNGFSVQGVDISETDISVAKARYPHIKSKFTVCKSDPNTQALYGSESSYSVITAFQSLYYFSKQDFDTVVKRLYDQLVPGGVFFATMMGEQSREFYDNSEATEDEWLRKVDFKNDRLNVENYFMFFVKDEDDLISKFKLFKPVHTGYYSAKLRSDEGDGFHYTFCGVK
jgi:cyclopropane fatty-acyl-phospholipid synthase-like methyltransferase